MSAIRTKIRIFDLAKHLRIDPKHLIEEVRREGVDVSVPSNSISKELAEKIREKYLPKKDTSRKRVIKLKKKAARASVRPKRGSVTSTFADISMRAARGSPRKPSDIGRKRIERAAHIICQLCGARSRSKEKLRMHFFRDHVSKLIRRSWNVGPAAKKQLFRRHVKEVLEGKASCHIRVNDLAGLFRISSRRVMVGAEQAGCKVSATSIEIPREFLREVTGNWTRKLTAERNLPKRPFRKSIIPFNEETVTSVQGLAIHGVKKIKWKLLPPGAHPFPRIAKYFEDLSTHRAHVKYDLKRLAKIHGLDPDETFIGLDEFAGYVVFHFRRVPIAVLDCPVTGNAIYVFGQNWRSLCRLTKSQLLRKSSRKVVRIVHRGEWFSRLRSLVATRKLQADLVGEIVL